MNKIDLSPDAAAIAAASAIKEALSLLEKNMVKGMAETMPLEVRESFDFYIGSHDPMFFAKEEDREAILLIKNQIVAETVKQFEKLF